MLREGGKGAGKERKGVGRGHWEEWRGGQEEYGSELKGNETTKRSE